MSGEGRLRKIPVLAILFAVLAACPAASADSSPDPSVQGVRGRVKGREARVQFQLRNAFPPEMVEALKSGIEISFRISVEVERVHKNWFDVQVGRVTRNRSVRYDALARVFRIHRETGGEAVPDLLEAIRAMEEYTVTLPLAVDAIPGKRYRARVRVRLDRVGLSDPLRRIFFFSSLWDLETDWAEGGLSAP